MSERTFVDGIGEELYDQRAVTAFTGQIVDEAREAGLNYLELYYAANSARLACLAQISRQAAAQSKVVEVEDGGRLKASPK